MQPPNDSGLPSAEPRAAGIPAGPIGSFLLLLLELLLITSVVYLFNIEARHYFFPVLCVLVGGFAIHAWLPRPLRLRFFAVLSLVCLLFVLGVASGLWVIGIGGALIGVWFLPVGRRVRLTLLLTAAATLVILRARFPLPIWPVLGSMFMFRLILFVYETRNQVARPPLTETLAYFFLAPNACFPLFPVVDYTTFRNCRYNEEERTIYQRGIAWMVRGITHLLLYRYIRTSVLPQPYELYDVTHVALWMVTNYGLYLQVSGQFHLITGLLHLFGFNLPRTHHWFFLASSFSDIWRRINIYWKDFLAKLFFFPTFHAVRSRGASLGVAIVSGVCGVFAATWLLHSWQTFWLLGRFPLTANDACLWLGAGACVAVNALLEARRQPSSRRRTSWMPLRNALQTVGMFGLVSLFWGCWTSPGFFTLLNEAFQRPGAAQGLLIVVLWLLFAVVAITMWNVARSRWESRAERWTSLTFRDSAQLHIVGLGLAVAVALPSFGKLLGPDRARALAAFRSDSPTESEAGHRLQSYYEDLNLATIQAGPLMQSLSPADEARRSQAQGFYKVSRAADLYQELELIPGVRTELDGSPFSVNQFGMRDRDSITLGKPPGTVRIALVGSSIVMGYGVGDDEVFGRLFEAGLNERSAREQPRCEVLNFGVGKQWATHRLVRIQRTVFGFEPDAIYYFAHQDEFQAVDSHPARLLAHDLDLPSPQMEAVARKAGVTREMAWGAIESHLHQYQSEMLGAVYRTIVDECRSRGIIPVYFYVPVPGTDGEDPGARLLSLARDAGFLVCDLSDWPQGHAPEDLFRASGEEHPDARGHRLIADALLKTARERPDILPQSIRD